MLFRVLAALLVIATTIVVLGSLGFRVNLTASLPLGVYRVDSEPPSRGSIVQVCLPRDVADFARRRGYLGPGSCPGGVRPLGKAVLAVEGDLVTLSHDEIRVNGAAVPNSGTVSEDSHGRALPHHPWGQHKLRAGEIWLFSPYHLNAYDSRYFGPIQSPLTSRKRRAKRASHTPPHTPAPLIATMIRGRRGSLYCCTVRTYESRDGRI